MNEYASVVVRKLTVYIKVTVIKTLDSKETFLLTQKKDAQVFLITCMNMPQTCIRGQEDCICGQGNKWQCLSCKTHKTVIEGDS